jgi:hypothetical protein
MSRKGAQIKSELKLYFDLVISLSPEKKYSTNG